MTPGARASRAEQLCTRVLELVADREPSAEAEANVAESRSALTRFANSFIHQNVGEQGPRVLLRVSIDGRSASGSTTSVGDEGLARLAETTVAAARLRPPDPDWPGLAPPAALPGVEHYDPGTAEAPPAERAAVVEAFVGAAPDLAAAGYCDTEGGSSAFANTAGHTAVARSSRATLDGIHQAGDALGEAAGKGHATSVALADLDGAGVGSVAAATARESLHATDLEPGRYEVVLAPECAAEMLAFLAFYGFNAKAVIEEQSFARLGDRQFDPAVSIADDVTDPRALGIPYDAEGTPKRRVDLVAAGRTEGLVHDRRTAARTGTESTGHAIPGGETYGAFASNAFLEAGDSAPADMVAGVERGVLVTELNYCRVLDPKTLVVTGLTRNGTFLVEGGRVSAALRNLRFTQSFVEALAPGAVTAIGDDARFAAAEFGVGMFHAPSLHLASWNFTGGARG